jgi:hypothetical protein
MEIAKQVMPMVMVVDKIFSPPCSIRLVRLNRWDQDHAFNPGHPTSS